MLHNLDIETTLEMISDNSLVFYNRGMRSHLKSHRQLICEPEGEPGWPESTSGAIQPHYVTAVPTCHFWWRKGYFFQLTSYQMCVTYQHVFMLAKFAESSMQGGNSTSVHQESYILFPFSKNDNSHSTARLGNAWFSWVNLRSWEAAHIWKPVRILKDMRQIFEECAFSNASDCN